LATMRQRQEDANRKLREEIVAKQAEAKAHSQHARDDNVVHHGNHDHTQKDLDQDSSFIFFVLLVVMILAQAGLYYWKKNHVRSFQNVTLFGLWIIPIIWYFSHVAVSSGNLSALFVLFIRSGKNGWFRMVTACSIFSS